jgi:isocitrate lyase
MMFRYLPRNVVKQASQRYYSPGHRTITTAPHRQAAAPPRGRVPEPSSVLPSDSYQLLSIADKVGAAEDALFEQQVRDVEDWWASPRYQGVKRPYSARDVVGKRGSLQQIYPSSLMARKLFNLLKERAAKGEPVHTSTPQGPFSLFKQICSLTRKQWAPSIPSR